MDFDDGEGSSEQTTKPSRFAPKPRFQPKSRPKPGAPSSAASLQPKTEPNNGGAPPVPVKKEQQDFDQLSDTAKLEDSGPSLSPPNVKGAKSEITDGGDPMDFELSIIHEGEGQLQPEVEDSVFREIDVYFNPSLLDGDTERQPSSNPSPPPDQGAQLFLLQYPLRPAWRPYELDERCTEVRVKRSSGTVEIDLSVDLDTNTYNEEFGGKFDKQTLSSKFIPSQRTYFAVGMFTGSELHLNPVSAVRQLRPSMDYLNVSDTTKKNDPVAATKATSSKAESSGNPNKVVNQNADPSIQLKFRGSSSDLATTYRKKMVSAVKSPITFPMKQLQYLNYLCPPAAIAKLKSVTRSKSSLLLLPLEQRLRLLFTEGPSVHKFSALKHYAPESEVSVEDLFKVLEQFALIVQGYWVAKTSIRLPNAKDANVLARDLLLCLFSQSATIKYSDVDDIFIFKKIGKDLWNELAIDRPKCKDWKFREPTDLIFIKQHPEIVESHKRKLKNQGETLLARCKRNPMKADASARVNPLQISDRSAASSGTKARTEGRTMSNEAREALPLALRKLFQSHKVCSIHSIRQGLRSMALNISTLAKADARVIKAAALGLDAPEEELLEAISEVVTDIHGTFVLKSSSEHPELNPLRNVVIQLFMGKGATAKVKKSEIVEAAKMQLQKEPSNEEFRKVMNELCKSQSSFWMLKSGDGAPDNAFG